MERMTSPLGPMFHGTSFPFKEGDVVLPPKTAGVWSRWKNDDPEGQTVDKDVDEKAYATTNLSWAQHFANYAHHYNNQGGQEGGYVYQVEPVDSTESPDIYHGRDYTEIKSRKGFRVIRRVSGE